MIVLDTTILRETMLTIPNPALVAWLDRQPRTELHLTAPTLAEARANLARIADAGRRRSFLSALARVTTMLFGGRVLAFDTAAAEAFGPMAADSGTALSPFPAMVAAIARVHGATIATGRLIEFDFPGLRLIDPIRGLRVASSRPG